MPSSESSWISEIATARIASQVIRLLNTWPAQQWTYLWWRLPTEPDVAQNRDAAMRKEDVLLSLESTRSGNQDTEAPRVSIG